VRTAFVTLQPPVFFIVYISLLFVYILPHCCCFVTWLMELRDYKVTLVMGFIVLLNILFVLLSHFLLDVFLSHYFILVSCTSLGVGSCGIDGGPGVTAREHSLTRTHQPRAIEIS
jgi:hypothetical protein